jgi:mannose-6-phosphate isomerase-like protein (cupin superfamily)
MSRKAVYYCGPAILHQPRQHPASGCVPPPPHIHRHQVEEYQVLEGLFEVVVDGEWRTLAPGESATVPIGALHTFRNRSGGGPAAQLAPAGDAL